MERVSTEEAREKSGEDLCKDVGQSGSFTGGRSDGIIQSKFSEPRWSVRLTESLKKMLAVEVTNDKKVFTREQHGLGEK